MMDIAELFRKGFKRWLELQPRGTQGKLSDELNIGRQHMSDFVNGRKMLSEEKRQQLAFLAGYTYIEFLKFAEILFEDEIGWEIKKPKKPKVSIELLGKIINAIETSQEKYPSLILVPFEKASLIAELYDSIANPDRNAKSPGTIEDIDIEFVEVPGDKNEQENDKAAVVQLKNNVA